MKLLLISLIISLNSFAMGGKRPCDIIRELPWCDNEEEPEPPPPPPEEPPEPPPPPPEEPPSDFAWDKVKKYGGNRIGIASDIASWEVTRDFTFHGFSGNNMKTSINPSGDYPGRCRELSTAVSGNFAACVKQDDGMYICGTWEWVRVGYQTTKTIKNLKGSMGDSFGLKKGSEICFFYTGCSRGSSRNVKERSDLACTVWPY